MMKEIYRPDGPTVVKVKTLIHGAGWTETRALAMTLAREIDQLREELQDHYHNVDVERDGFIMTRSR